MELDDSIFHIQPHNESPGKGRVLISEPYSPDSYFTRSVVLLTEHNEEGSVGFILNKPIQLSIDKLLPDFPRIDAPFSFGGPVQSESLYYLHTLGQRVPNSIHIVHDIYWGGSFEAIKLLIDVGEVAPEQIRFFMGYSGWMPQQLDTELQRNFWLIGDLEQQHIMNNNHEDLWRAAVSNMGDTYKMWLNFPKNPSMN